MKRTILYLSFPIAAMLPKSAQSQVIVEDPIAIAQNAIQHTIDLAKYVEMISNQIEQINLLTSQLEQITAYVTAFGDPATLLQITGADQIIGQLQQSQVGQLLGELQQTASGIESLHNNADGLYQTIENISISGVEIPRAEDLYRKFGALENTTANYQMVHEEAVARIQSLKQEISSTTTALQSATTDAQVQKLHGVLASQNAQLAALQGEVQNATSQVLVQDTLNRNDDEKQSQAQREKDAAEWGITTKQFDALLTLPDSMRR
ncbi:hypothetical protein FEM03_07290 [Phragmitibacter flavus]|uniref:P-type conjugative transfer protein TrbJ n=1 Tax=Phragmitibacter flavus TaxID=2576071 RepID=A0A5R8KG90_9BACT|nr:hypothetical protein [Phragmitibacter flavus]TLD71327.1 hypothetical protein FEM03_07290 [Phragmitibacter flavus]